MNRPRLLLAPALGFGIWAIGFVAIYAVQGTGCALGWDRLPLGPVPLLRALLVALTAATLVAALLAARRLSRLRRRVPKADRPAALVLSVAALCAWLAIPAIALTFSGVVAATACAPA